VTTGQKAQIVEVSTEPLQRVPGQCPEHTHIIIEEIEPENWVFSGLPSPEFLEQQRSQYATEAMRTATPTELGDQSLHVLSLAGGSVSDGLALLKG